ncbi:MAG: 30S ribosome-binding factor RbfA [Candidatus Pacebacteria bacterium]|nr:30S ribosome-binding factor RbfA [Candidatus Paceibacterota bacterium]
MGREVRSGGKFAQFAAAESGRESAARSQRQLRVGEEIRHSLARIFAREQFRDPELNGQTLTVTEVRISPDLKNATVFIVVMGQVAESAEAKKVIKALSHAAPFIRGLLAKDMVLRVVPSLSFVSDASFDQAARITELLARPEIVRDIKV